MIRAYNEINSVTEKNKILAVTKCKFQSGVGGVRAADSRIAVQSYRT